MDTVNPTKRARLIQRRSEITVTLRHVEREQQDIEAKQQSMDPMARARRLVLLRDLSDWYSREFKQLDRLLRRVDQKRYRVCMACRAPIAAELLKIFPAAKFCANCQNFRKEL